MVSITLNLDIEGTERDFFDQVVADNEGEALQKLAKGKISEFLTITDEEKKRFSLELLERDFSQRFNNSQIEKRVQEFREAEFEKLSKKH